MSDVPAEITQSKRGSDAVLFTMLGKALARIEDVDRNLSVTKDTVEEFGIQLGAHIAQDSAEHQRNFSDHQEFARVQERLIRVMFGTDEEDGEDGVVTRIRAMEDQRAIIRAIMRWAIAGAIGAPAFAVACMELYHRLVP